MSTFDDNFPAKGKPIMADRAFGFDSEERKNAGFTNQALYDLFKSELDPTLPKPADFLPAFDLDNIRVMTSTDPDGKLVKSNVLDKSTGEYATFKEVDSAPGIDNVIYTQVSGKTFKRVFNGSIPVQWFGAKVDDPTFNSGPAIQAALDSIYPNIDISGGDFFVHASLQARSNKVITGNGSITRFQENTSSPTINVGDNVKNFKIIGSIKFDSRSFLEGNTVGNANTALRIQGTGIEGIYMEGITLLNAGRDGVYINDHTNTREPRDITFRSVTIDRITRNGISIINGDGISFFNCTVSNWQLCGVDMEPNAHVLPLKNITFDQVNRFIQPAGNNRAVIQASISGGDTPDPILHLGINILNNYIKGNGLNSAIRVNQFSESKIIGNTIEGFGLTGIVSNGDGNIITNNKLRYPTIYTYDAGTFYTGAINAYGKNLSIKDNEIKGANYHGIFVSNSDGSVVSGNKTHNIGQSTGASSTTLSGIFVQNTNRSTIVDNTSDDNQSTPTTKIGVYVRVATGQEGFDNTIKDNKVLNSLITPVQAMMSDKQRIIQGNDVMSDPIKNGRIVSTLPSASEDVRGRIFRINSTGSNKDRFYVCILNSDTTYSWVEVFTDSTVTIPDATATQKGIVELATSTETREPAASASQTLAVTPYGLAFRTATSDRTGLIQLAGDLEGSATTPTVKVATTSIAGKVRMSTTSANTATAASGETPTKAEFDALLTELRDLKTKMRTAGLLAN